MRYTDRVSSTGTRNTRHREIQWMLSLAYQGRCCHVLQSSHVGVWNLGTNFPAGGQSISKRGLK